MAVSMEEAVRLALAELGDATNALLAAFVGMRFGLRVEPRFVPVLKASLLVRQQREHFRAQARGLVPATEAVAQAPTALPPDSAPLPGTPGGDNPPQALRSRLGFPRGAEPLPSDGAAGP